MSQRQLNILVIYADSSAMWIATEARLRSRLADHVVHVVYSLREAAPYVPAAEVILCFAFSNDHAKQAAALRWIQGFGSGVESLVTLPDLAPHVIITNMRGIHGATVSEHVLASMFALSRDLMRAVRNQDRRLWAPWPASLLEGSTLGILGVGTIAECLAIKARGLGMTTVGISGARVQAPGFDRIFPRARLIEVVATVDYLVLLVPLTPATRGIIDAAVLAAMKPTAYLINVGRGSLVKEEALVAALDDGTLAGAALDTFAHEPLPPENPLWRYPNVLITPHNATRHDRYVDDALAIFTANLQHYLAGRTEHMINRIERPSA